MSYVDVTSTINSLKTQTNAVNYAKNKAAGNDTVNQDVFLQLMVTQLQNQNPLDPMDNTEFLSQQAQFSQVTALQDMKESLTKYGDALLSMNNSMLGASSFSQAMNVVGKEVTVVNPDDPTTTITGIVDSVKLTDEGEVYLSVNGKEVTADSIKSVSNGTTSSNTASSIVQALESSDVKTTLKNTAGDLLEDVLNNPKLRAVASDFIETLAGKLF